MKIIPLFLSKKQNVPFFKLLVFVPYERGNYGKNDSKIEANQVEKELDSKKVGTNGRGSPLGDF